jgi:hypothetical protein
MNALPMAGAWCVLLLGAQWLRAKAYGRKPLFAPAAGDPASGVRYAFTGAMAPQAKESVRRNPVSYGAGLAFHAGAGAAFALLLLPLRPLGLRALAGPLGLLALAGALAGLGLLLKRLLKAHLRGLSNADDYLSNLLVTGFAALTGLSVFLPGLREAAAGWCAVLLFYVPLGKIRHCVFFFLSRYHLGAFFGRRGVFPPA